MLGESFEISSVIALLNKSSANFVKSTSAISLFSTLTCASHLLVAKTRAAEISSVLASPIPWPCPRGLVLSAFCRWPPAGLVLESFVTMSHWAAAMAQSQLHQCCWFICDRGRHAAFAPCACFITAHIMFHSGILWTLQFAASCCTVAASSSLLVLFRTQPPCCSRPVCSVHRCPHCDP